MDQKADTLHQATERRTVLLHCNHTQPAVRPRTLSSNVDAKEGIDPSYTFKFSHCDCEPTKTNRGMYSVSHFNVQSLKFVKTCSNSFSLGMEGRKWLHTLNGSDVTGLLSIS